MKYKFLSLVGSFILLVGLVSGSVSSAQDKVVLRIGHQEDIVNVDPAHLAAVDRTFAQNVLQGLIEVDLASAEKPMPIVKVLAEDYKVSPDARKITFYLRKGVQFHHGYGEMTSEDVKFSIMRHLDPAVASSRATQFADIERIEIPDKYTVEIYLKHSSAFTLLGPLAYQQGFMMSKKATEELGDKIQIFPVGTGPWEFVEWKPREEIILRKFADYWGEPPGVDELHFKIIPDEPTRFLALEKGELDITPVIAAGSYELALAIEEIRLIPATMAIEMQWFYINHEKEPMNNVKVRKALAYALNIEEMAQALGPQITACPTPFCPAVVGGTTDFWTYEYDPEYAKQLLAEAGYPDGFKMTMIYKVTKFFEQHAMWLKYYWEKIGIDVELVLIEVGVFGKNVTSMYDGKAHGAVWGMTRFAPLLYADRFLTGSPGNHYSYSNPEVDHAIQKASYALTEETAVKWWRRVQMILCEDVAGIWPIAQQNFVAVREDIRGVVPSPHGGVMDCRGVYLED